MFAGPTCRKRPLRCADNDNIDRLLDRKLDRTLFSLWKLLKWDTDCFNTRNRWAQESDDRLDRVRCGVIQNTSILSDSILISPEMDVHANSSWSA